MAKTRRVRVPLDHNFPAPLLEAFARYLPEVDLLPIRRIDARLIHLADDELIVQLRQLGYGLLVTNDRMLNDPATLVAIEQTRLSVFVIEGVGDDPVRATGAVLLDCLPALRKLVAHEPQVFRMHPRAPTLETPRSYLTRVAEHRGAAPDGLYRTYSRSRRQLESSILEPPLDLG